MSLGFKRLISNEIKHRYYQSFIYSPTDAPATCLKDILKFTIKQLRHVSVQLHHLQGAHYPCLPKLHIKIYNETAPTCFGAVTPSSCSALIRAY